MRCVMVHCHVAQSFDAQLGHPGVLSASEAAQVESLTGGPC